MNEGDKNVGKRNGKERKGRETEWSGVRLYVWTWEGEKRIMKRIKKDRRLEYQRKEMEE